MTPEEIKTERRYRIEERIGICLANIVNPTSEQLAASLRLANADADEWERICAENNQPFLF